MITLRIEHAITDIETWLTAFGGFTEVRKGAGVRSERIYQPVDDPGIITLDLGFDDIRNARDFEHFLRTEVWSSPSASPALTGDVRTQILSAVPAAARTHEKL
jgi:hypothetical protein